MWGCAAINWSLDSR
jgi:hypothetical protein